MHLGSSGVDNPLARIPNVQDSDVRNRFTQPLNPRICPGPMTPT